MANLKLRTNVPEIINFKFDTWKEWDNEGKDGERYKTYSIGVENRGVDTYFSVYEKEYLNIFKPLGNLKDRIIEVLKYEDGKYKAWKILENGVDITPGRQSAPSSNVESSVTSPVESPVAPLKSPTSVSIEEVMERIDKMAKWASDVEKRLSGIETLLVDTKGQDAVDLHQSFPESRTDEFNPKSPLGIDYTGIPSIHE